MSLKRKLIRSGNSTDFEMLEVSSGSETESATEESFSAQFEGNFENTKVVVEEVPQPVEVLLVEEGPVDRTIERVQPIDVYPEIPRKKRKCEVPVDLDEEIFFLKEETPKVKSLSQIAAAACKYPVKSQGTATCVDLAKDDTDEFDDEIQVLSVHKAKKPLAVEVIDLVNDVEEANSSQDKSLSSGESSSSARTTPSQVKISDDSSEADSELKYDNTPFYQNQMEDNEVRAEFDKYYNDWD